MVGVSYAFVGVGGLLQLLKVVGFSDSNLGESLQAGVQVEPSGVEDGVKLVLGAISGPDASAGHLLDGVRDQGNIVFIKSLEIII